MRRAWPPRWLLGGVLTLAACAPTGTVTGPVVAVEGDLTEVSSFTILSESGDRIELRPSPDGVYAFPLPHLRDHLRAGDPVRVSYTEEDGNLVALTLDDG